MRSVGHAGLAIAFRAARQADRTFLVHETPAKSPGARSGARPEEAWSLRVWQRGV
jgi:hypothetical protein